ncbi:MAG TPA: glycine cleavage system protein GcvH [Pseudonocardia sp.]|nr:glycine cleavage system protein GcvH [Pseudonocardia sp.]
MIPEDLRYTDQHEWVREVEPGLVRVGITDHAQQALGDVVFVQLPEAGASMARGAVAGEVESTKSVSEIFAPLAGEVAAVNEALGEHPELVNSAPYGDGWLFDLRTTDDDRSGLIDAAGYRSLTESG